MSDESLRTCNTQAMLLRHSSVDATSAASANQADPPRCVMLQQLASLERWQLEVEGDDSGKAMEIAAMTLLADSCKLSEAKMHGEPPRCVADPLAAVIGMCLQVRRLLGCNIFSESPVFPLFS